MKRNLILAALVLFGATPVWGQDGVARKIEGPERLAVGKKYEFTVKSDGALVSTRETRWLGYQG